MSRATKDLILVGGGGHCRSCIDVIEAEDRFRIAGIVDLEEKLHQKVLSYKIIAGDSELPKLVRKHKNVLITIGHIKDSRNREEKFQYLKKIGANFPVIVSPSARVSCHALIGEGVIVMHNAIINANAAIDRNCIINTGAILEHDTKVGSHCHVSTGSIINGGCRLGEGVFIGSNAVLSNNVSIAAKTVIGAGAVVIRSIEKGGVYAGNPARKIIENA